MNRRCTWCCPFSGPTSASPHRNRPNDTRLKYVDFFCGPHWKPAVVASSTTCASKRDVFRLHDLPSSHTTNHIPCHIPSIPSTKHIHIHIMVHQSHIRCSQLFSIHILFSCPESCSTNRRLSSFCVPLDSLLVRPSPSERSETLVKRCGFRWLQEAEPHWSETSLYLSHLPQGCESSLV